MCRGPRFAEGWKTTNPDLTPRLKPCDPEEAMKILVGILAVLVAAASLFADYKWRRWMANRRTDEDLSLHPKKQRSLLGDPGAGIPPARRRDRQ